MASTSGTVEAHVTRTDHLDLESDAAAVTVRGAVAAGGPSLLFPDGEPGGDVAEPPFFRDLNLDQIVAAIVGPRDEYGLRPFFHRPLHRADAVAYRHEVFRDLESEAVRSAVLAFATEARRVRRWLSMARSQHYPIERRRWLVDAAATYCAAVRALVDALVHLPLRSRGFRAVRAALAGYVASAEFTSLCAEADRVLAGLARVRYTVLIDGARVTVSTYGDEADYAAEVERLFARFREDGGEDHLVKVSDSGSMDHVEARIADRVARLFPDELQALEAFSARHGAFFDGRVAAFERETQFYLAVAEHTTRLAAAGISFCYPRIHRAAEEMSVEGAVDLALAASAVAQRRPVVPNDFRLEPPERILAVTGPNQGGKTTFARMVGQLHHLAGLGMPVPARTASLRLPDRILTHFARVEDIATLRGRLDDELVRVRDIVETAGPDSLVILNEVFASTTLDDAVLLGTRVLGRIAELGCTAVCVTFVDELSRLGDSTVSMVAAVDPDDPSVRTFRVRRAPADGRAYAWAIADRYGLSYDRLRGRIAP
jgi:DNA mismatch repair protein MutS